MVGVSQQLAYGAANTKDAEETCVDPAGGATEAMAGAENDAGDEGWDKDDELHNGNVAGAVELHGGGGGDAGR